MYDFFTRKLFFFFYDYYILNEINDSKLITVAGRTEKKTIPNFYYYYSDAVTALHYKTKVAREFLISRHLVQL